MNRMIMVLISVCVVGLVIFGLVTVSRRTEPKIAATLEKQIGKQEVRRVDDCSKVVAVRTYEDGRGTMPWYENDMLLANGRRVTRRRDLFIRQPRELMCDFWVVPVSG